MRLLGAIGYCFHIIMKVRGSLIIADIRREFKKALFSGEKRAVGEEGSLVLDVECRIWGRDPSVTAVTAPLVKEPRGGWLRGGQV